MSSSRTARPAPEDVVLLAAVVGLPWFYGGASLGAQRVAALVVALSAAIALLRRGIPAPRWSPDWRWAGAACCVFAFLQATPLPHAWVASLSPGTARLAHAVLPPDAAEGALRAAAEARLPRDAGAAPAPTPSDAFAWPAWSTISLAPSATLESAFWWTALLIAALVATSRARRPEARDLYRNAFFVLVGSLAAFGLLQAATWNGKMFWLREQSGRPFGPYVNSNHFAGLMELGLPWIAGYLAMRVRRRGLEGLRNQPGALALATLALGLVAVLVSRSRAGALLSFGAVTVVLLAAARGRSRAIAAGALLATWLAAAALIVWTPAGERFRDAWAARGGVAELERVEGWKGCIPMLRDFPLLGSGVGAFRWVYPHYLPAGESQQWLQAHNDWLETALDGGAVLSVLVVVLAAGLARAAARAWRHPIRRGDRELQTGLIAGLAALSLHALVDFNHQIPANALAFTVAAALAAAPAAERAVEES